MRWTAVILLPLLAGMVRAEDPRIERWNSFYTMNIRSRWVGIEESESRVITVRGVVKCDCAPAARWLMEIISTDSAGNVKREAVRVLSGFKSPEARQAMAAYWEKGYSKDVEAKTLALQVFGASKAASAKRPIELGLTKEKDSRVIAAACKAAGVRPAHRVQASADQAAEVQTARRARRRGDGARRVARHRDHARHLHDVLQGQEQARALRRVDGAQATLPEKASVFARRLAEVVGGAGLGRSPRAKPNPWGVKFPRIAKDWERRAYFFGIPVLGDRVVFVLDSSLRMNNPWAVDHAAQRKLPPEQRIPAFFSVKTRWDLQRNHALKCVENFVDKTEVVFSFYRHEVAVFPTTGKLLRLNGRRVRRAADAFEEAKRSGSTAMYEGLAAGWGFLKEGHPDTNFKKGCDTLVFCTNGQPSEGEFKNRKDALRDEVWRISNARHIRVHAVGLQNHAFASWPPWPRIPGGCTSTRRRRATVRTPGSGLLARQEEGFRGRAQEEEKARLTAL